MIALMGCSALQSDRIDEHLKGLTHKERVSNRQQAYKIFTQISNANDQLDSFKGIGRFTLRKGTQPDQSERIAWIGAPPNRLKVIILAFGRPAMKVATDGHYLYYVDFSETRQPYRKIRTTDANLKNVLSIPIKSSEILELLRGRIPSFEFSDVGILHPDGSHHYILVFAQNWKGVVAKVIVDSEHNEIQTIERFTRDGGLIYRARFAKLQTVNGYRVPARLELSNEKGVMLRLNVERYFTDVDINAQMFVLAPPAQ